MTRRRASPFFRGVCPRKISRRPHLRAQRARRNQLTPCPRRGSRKLHFASPGAAGVYSLSFVSPVARRPESSRKRHRRSESDKRGEEVEKHRSNRFPRHARASRIRNRKLDRLGAARNQQFCVFSDYTRMHPYAVSEDAPGLRCAQPCRQPRFTHLLAPSQTLHLPFRRLNYRQSETARNTRSK